MPIYKIAQFIHKEKYSKPICIFVGKLAWKIVKMTLISEDCPTLEKEW